MSLLWPKVTCNVRAYNYQPIVRHVSADWFVWTLSEKWNQLNTPRNRRRRIENRRNYSDLPIVLCYNRRKRTNYHVRDGCEKTKAARELPDCVVGFVGFFGGTHCSPSHNYLRQCGGMDLWADGLRYPRELWRNMLHSEHNESLHHQHWQVRFSLLFVAKICIVKM